MERDVVSCVQQEEKKIGVRKCIESLMEKDKKLQKEKLEWYKNLDWKCSPCSSKMESNLYKKNEIKSKHKRCINNKNIKMCKQ